MIEIKIFDNTGKITQQESHENKQSFKLDLNNNSKNQFNLGIKIKKDDKK